MPLFSSSAPKEDEHDLFYFHGSLPDADADKQLEKDGDFLIQAKYIVARTHSKLCLAVRKDNQIERREIERLVDGYRLGKVNVGFFGAFIF